MRRVCVPCSLTTGYIVRRQRPTAMRLRAEKKAARLQQAKVDRKAMREASYAWPVVLHRVWKLMLRLPTARKYRAGKTMLEFMRNSRGSLLGRAYPGMIRVKTSHGVGSILTTMLHELAHVVVWRRFGVFRPQAQGPHGKLFSSTFRNLVDEWAADRKGREIQAVVGLIRALAWLQFRVATAPRTRKHAFSEATDEGATAGL